MLNKIYKQLVFTVVVVLITFFGNVQTSADARSSYYLRFWCATDMGGEPLQIN